MVTRAKKDDVRKRKKIKVLSLKKETVKDLTRGEARGVKGGTGVCLSGPVSGRNSLSGVGQSVITSSGQFNSSLRGSGSI
jgi:hypothetical protein